MKMVDGKLQLFDIKGTNSSIKKEVIGGLTTFFAMSYIIITNPSILSSSGVPRGAVFIATILASIIGTLIMGLFADVPYAQAPGMGLNAFFAYTVCGVLGFSWQEALTMVFVCGLINIIITITKVRKTIIKAIPKSLQAAISGGIGLFIAYLGLLNAGFIDFSSGVPAMASGSALWNSSPLIVFLIGLIICIVLNVLKVKGAMIITILATTLIGLIPFFGEGSAVTTFGALEIGSAQYGYMDGFIDAFEQLPQTFGVIFTGEGFGSLFNDGVKAITAIITIFSFSLSDTFDTLGTFIGTGRKSGIFTDEDLASLETSKGFKSKMDRALFADSVATSIGAIFGTSNTTTFVESASGIGAGARTGLASCVTALCFLVSIFFAGPISAVPMAATAPVLIVVGCMMLSNFKDIDWHKLEEAIPAFFLTAFMAFCYSISYGIAMGFITYCLVKIALFIKDFVIYKKITKDNPPVDGEIKDQNGNLIVKPKLGISIILAVSAALFLLNFILLATPLMHK